MVIDSILYPHWYYLLCFVSLLAILIPLILSKRGNSQKKTRPQPRLKKPIRVVKKKNGKKKKRIIRQHQVSKSEEGTDDNNYSSSNSDSEIMSGLSSNWKSLQKKLGTSGSKTKTKVSQTSKISKSGTLKSSSTKKTTTKSAAAAVTEKFDPHSVSKINSSASGKIIASKVLKNEDAELALTTTSEGSTQLMTPSVMGKKSEIGNYLSLDCEFVGVGPGGADSALARISIVNYYGHVIIDKFVRPKERVTDWRTWVSGVTPKDMKNAVSFESVQKEVSDLLESRILVGHAVQNDLKVLMISHPKHSIRDTSHHKPFRQLVKGTPSLKVLAQEVLNINIQSGEHSSVEDAQATMLLFRLNKKQFDTQNASRRSRRN